MAKKSFFNIVDYGTSNIRVSIYNSELIEKFSETYTNLLNERNLDHLNVLTNIIKKAEKKISSHIEDLIVILDSKQMFVIDLCLNKNLEKKSKISQVYETLLLELNQLIEINYNQLYINHVILNNCIINKKKFNSLPESNQEISNIKISFKLICYPRKLINSIKSNFAKNNLNINNIFCASYLKTLTYLRNLNNPRVCFLEIGWERTSLIIYDNSKLKYIKSIPIGSFHITKDISKIFKISLEDAEKIKKSFNKTETEFSYNNNYNLENMTVKEILNKNISTDTLKRVILYRVQEIIDLSFKNINLEYKKINLKNSDLFLIGGGSILFDNNSFYLDDKFEFNSINFYHEKDSEICNSGLIYYMNNYELPKKTKKNQGIFERFFNFFGK